MFLGVDFVTFSVEALRAARPRELTIVRRIVLSGLSGGAVIDCCAPAPLRQLLDAVYRR